MKTTTQKTRTMTNFKKMVVQTIVISMMFLLPAMAAANEQGVQSKQETIFSTNPYAEPIGPNSPYNVVRNHWAKSDYYCRNYAQEVANNTASRAAESAFMNGLFGAATGAAIGAAAGDPATGAAIGGGYGFAAGATQNGYPASVDYQNAYNYCMSTRGF